jgi:hypothetical protein
MSLEMAMTVVLLSISGSKEGGSAGTSKCTCVAKIEALLFLDDIFAAASSKRVQGHELLFAAGIEKALCYLYWQQLE